MEKKIKPVNLYEKVAEVEETWSPVIAAEMDGYHFKLARIKGEFVWHRHDDTDEVFFVLGCESVEPPNVKDGEPARRGTFKDFAGNIWSVATQL